MEERGPAEVFHPGEHLLDELEARGWSQVEFAEIIGRSARLVNEVINGRRGITPETAVAFAAALGTSAEFWMNLETSYQLWKTSEDVAPIAHRARMRDQYPVRDMMLRGWIRPSEDSDVVEAQLLKFFKIGSLDERPELAYATKRSNSGKGDLTPIQVAWLYKVSQLAGMTQVPEFSAENLRSALKELRALTEAPEGVTHVPALLEESGVRLVVVEPLPSSKIDGVCLWMGPSPVIGLSLRYDRIDNFWFVLRHEVEHVLRRHGKDAAILDSEVFEIQEHEGLTDEERAANSAAAEFCVPQSELIDFIARKDPYFGRRDVVGFAQNHHVHPGLVVGQLQWRTKRFDLFRNFLVSIKELITAVAMTDGYGRVVPIQT